MNKETAEKLIKEIEAIEADPSFENCPKCGGSGTGHEMQDGMLGEEWCHDCGGPGWQVDETHKD